MLNYAFLMLLKTWILKNGLIKVDMVIDLFGMLVYVNVNVINQVILINI